MEKLQSQRERRKRRERTKLDFIFLRVTFLHSRFQHLHYSSCCVSAVPIHLPSCCGKGIFPISQSKQSPGHVPQGAMGCVHVRTGGLVLHREKRFPSAGGNGRAPSWPTGSSARLILHKTCNLSLVPSALGLFVSWRPAHVGIRSWQWLHIPWAELMGSRWSAWYLTEESNHN